MTAKSDVTRMATKIANRRAREEILPLLTPFVTPASLKVLRRSWQPFKAVADSSEYGYVLKTSDKLVIIILQKQDLYDKTHDIAMESMVEAMVDSVETKTFVQGLIDELTTA
jgi:hypothetical protein